MEIYINEITLSPLEELRKQYEYKNTIASGGFGTVIRAIQLTDGREVAIKIIRKDTWKHKASSMKQEIEILKQLKHPNILEFIGYIETNLKLYIIMEYIKDGTLKAWIKEAKDNITEQEARIIVERLILAANYLHAKDICHRDIKLENLMLNDRNDLTSIKLIDFGLSADHFNTLEEHQYCGTFIFMSPEQLTKRAYSKYVDLWSIGIVMFILLHSGKHPFYKKGDTKKSYIEKMKNPQYEVSKSISK